MLSAATAAVSGASVLLLEKTKRYGWKLSITGKGRCNVTNNCPPEEVLNNIPTNPRFLYSAVWGFPPEMVMELFEDLGVPLKTERGNRVFPQSDKAGDIVAALRRYMREAGVFCQTVRATRLLTEKGNMTGVETDNSVFHASKVILATGGMSYPATGSTGDGYEMARAVGHTIVPPTGSLVPLKLMGGECRLLAGLSLRNVGLKLFETERKPSYEDFGEALFLPYGMSGPIILSASAHMKDNGGQYVLELDLKPALDEKKLDTRLLRDFAQKQNKTIYEGIRGLLPAQLVPVILDRCGISAREKVHDVTKEQRRRILECMKSFRFQVAGKRPVEEAIVTHGGVSVSEVEPATMESKLVKGLYFAGEILDCDGYTGGFNLQIAWSTAHAAGSSCGNSNLTVV